MATYAGRSGFRRFSLRKLVKPLLLLLAALLLISLGRATVETSNAEPESALRIRTSSAASTSINGIPAGYAKTEVGAQAAAIDYARLISISHFWDKNSRDNLIRQIATESESAQMIQRYDQIAKAVRAGSGLPIEYEAWQQPVDLFLWYLPARCYAEVLGNEATVSIWHTSLLGANHSTGSAISVQNWSINKVRLVWQQDWKFRSIASQDGPVPPLDGARPNPTTDFSVVAREFKDCSSHVG